MSSSDWLANSLTLKSNITITSGSVFILEITHTIHICSNFATTLNTVIRVIFICKIFVPHYMYFASKYVCFSKLINNNKVLKFGKNFSCLISKQKYFYNKKHELQYVKVYTYNSLTYTTML